MKFSMWEKTCESVIENSAYLSLTSESGLELPLSSAEQAQSLRVDYGTKGRAQLNLDSEMDFSNDENFLLCTRMHVPAFPLRYT